MDSIFQNLLINQTKQPNLDLNYGTSPRTQYFQQAAANQLQDYAPALSTLSEYNDNNLNHLNNLLKMNLSDNFQLQNEQAFNKARQLDDEFRQRDFNDRLKMLNIQRNYAKQDRDAARKEQEEEDLARRRAAVDRILYQKQKEQQNNLPFLGRNFAGVNPNQHRIDELTDQYNNLSDLSNITNDLDYTDKYNLDLQLEKALDQNDSTANQILKNIRTLASDTTTQDFYRKHGGDSYYTGQKLSQPIQIYNDNNRTTQNVLAAMENNPLQDYYLAKNFRDGDIFNTGKISPQQKENLKSVADFMDNGGYMFLDNGYNDLPEEVADSLSSVGININNYVPIVTMDGDIKLVDKETNMIYDPIVDDLGFHLETVSSPNKLGMFDALFNYFVGK